jgi:hypothetical protein
MLIPQISARNIHHIQITQLHNQGRIFGSAIGHGVILAQLYYRLPKLIKIK